MGKSKLPVTLLGGFLGAGKTTLVGELAKRYSAQGKRVGIITNDQTLKVIITERKEDNTLDSDNANNNQ